MGGFNHQLVKKYELLKPLGMYNIYETLIISMGV